MLWPLTPRSRATSVTFLPDAIRSRTRRLNSGGYRLAMPTSSWGYGHDESNDATPPKWGNINVSTKAGQDHCRHRCRRPRGCHRLLHRTPYGAGGQGTSRDLGWICVVGLDDARVEITPDGQDDSS